MQALLPHASTEIKITAIAVHYDHILFPIVEPFAPETLAEYLNAGCVRVAVGSPDTINLMLPRSRSGRA